MIQIFIPFVTDYSKRCCDHLLKIPTYDHVLLRIANCKSPPGGELGSEQDGNPSLPIKGSRFHNASAREAPFAFCPCWPCRLRHDARTSAPPTSIRIVPQKLSLRVRGSADQLFKRLPFPVF